jgi:uncharacterized protein (DUF2141 family)
MKKILMLSIVSLTALSACSNSKVSQKAVEGRPAGEGRVEITVVGVESAKGRVYASVYLTPDGFPEDKTLAYDYRSGAASPGAMVFTFESVPAGWFVIAVLHDENGDEELSLNAFGIPSEDYGFSLNPDSIWGPPDFDESAVYLEPGETEQLTIEF